MAVQKPRFVPPQLAALVAAPPTDGGWIHEMKWDGYRAELAIAGGHAAFYTRRGQDWSADFPAIIAAAARLACRSALVDGEACVLDAHGVPDFNRMGKGAADAVYFAFDLLSLDGRDLKRLPLLERKALLKDLLARSPAAVDRIRYSDHVEGGGAAFFKVACAHRLEGIVSKEAAAPYRSGRSAAWRKTKCTLRQEFVVGGWLPRSDDPKGVGALLVGYFKGRDFKFVGKVGTGFNGRTRRQLLADLARAQRAAPAFQAVPDAERRAGAKWADPRMVVEVEFRGFTGDGILRHSSFKGVRRDKPAREVGLELPRPEPSEETIRKMKPRWRRV